MWSKVAKAGTQSGSIMGVADIVTQILVEGKSLSGSDNDGLALRKDGTSNEPFDPLRTFRWALAGLTLHGPYFFVGFSRVDAYYGAAAATAAPSLPLVAKKTAIAQFILFPPYLVALFAYMGVMEGHSVTEIQEKVKNRVPEAFLGGCVYWPVANGLNFAFVPSTLRVPYLATSAGIWNCYLSWTNARSQQK